MTKKEIETEEDSFKPEVKEVKVSKKCSNCSEAPVEVKLNECCDHEYCADCFFILSSNGDTCSICNQKFKSATHLFTNKTITME
jgi:hypothetical protein